MRGIDKESRKYHQKMANREKELQEMIERKERTIEQRIAGQEPGYNKRSIPTPIRREKHKPSAKKTREEDWLGENTPPRQSSRRQAPRQQEARQSSAKPSSGRQYESRAEEVRNTIESWSGSRSRTSSDNSKTLGRVIRTVVILYIVFGVFAGVVPRVVGNLGEFVSDIRDGFSKPEPEYEIVTEEVVREEKIFLQTASVEFILKTEDWMETLDQAQSFLAFEYSPEGGEPGPETWMAELQELDVYQVTPPESVSTYWDFFLQEYDWTMMMMNKAVNNESYEGDFESLNLLQYDKFAELVRVWNEEGVDYEVSFRTYDYKLIPKTE